MANFFEQRERDYQNSLVKRFQDELNYTYLGNLQYPQNATVNNNGTHNSPIIDSELCNFLREQGRTDFQISDVLTQLKQQARLTDKKISSLVTCNNNLYQTLTMGIKSRPSPDENHQNVNLFDFNNIYNNHFAIAEEVSYIDPLTGINRRPDIVVYVNGIALAVIELKRSLVNSDEAIRQFLTNECETIPSFFTTVQFTVASNDKVDFKYATIATAINFWCQWKRDTTETGQTISEKESYNIFFDKQNFMFFFLYGVLNSGGRKIVLRPHQLYALKAAAARMPKKESGVIWHSQGSGKSLTMVALAAYIRRNFPNPRVLVITDRKELDFQLAATFIQAGNQLHHASSSSDLLQTLNSGSEWLICSLIHKFGAHNQNDNPDKDDSGTIVSLDDYLNELQSLIAKQYNNSFSVKGDNIFVFVDECHRTQSGRLHQAMRAIMGKDVMLIGFTGTPLLKKDKAKAYEAFKNTSVATFGAFIHKYLHKQAVEDKVILDLEYEFRDVTQELTDKERVNQKVDSFDVKNEEQKKQVEDRWATLERIYSTKKRIEKIGNSILDDYEKGLLQHDWCNAILVAGSIYQAYRYYEFFCSEDGLKGRCAVVTSYNPSDADLRNKTTDTNKTTESKYKYDQAKKSFQEAGVDNADDYEEWAKNLFINQPAQMKLLIVVNKLLTGFDAPCATILYIDSDIRDHTLFQAICRVNRLGQDIKDENGNTVIKSHKEFGRIVDFKNLFNSIKSVVTKFNDGTGFENFDPKDIEGLLNDAVKKSKEKLEAAASLFKALKSEWQSKNLNNNDQLGLYYTSELPGEPDAKERRDTMYKVTETMVSAYNNMADFFARSDISPEQKKEFETLSREAGTINRKVKQLSGDDFDPRTFDPDMRQLLDRFIDAKEAEFFVPSDADFSFLDLLSDDSDAEKEAEKAITEAQGHDEGAAELIEGKARAVNNNWNSGDDNERKRFADRLQALLDDLKNRNASAKEKITALINYIKEVKHGSDTPSQLSSKRTKALWNNRPLWHAPSNNDDAINIIMKIDKFITYNAAPDWYDPESNAASELFLDLHDLLPNLSDQDIYQIYSLAAKNA